MIASYQKNLFKDAANWFTELANLAQNTEDTTSLPKLELHLDNGSRLGGTLLQARKNANDFLLMIMSLPDAYSKSEITLVSSSHVVAITLVDTNSYLKIFAAPASAPVVGSLELKRAIKSKETELEKIIGTPLLLSMDVDRLDEKSRGEVMRTLGYLPAIFESLTTDDLGKKLVQDTFNSIQIAIGNTATIVVKDKTLDITILSPLPIKETQEKERIKIGIETLL